MYPEINIIPDHMKEFGFGLLSKSIIDLAFGEKGYQFRYAIACTSCAHATEILIKSRIAQEHPLLIFSKLPNFDTKSEKNLDFQDLFERGRTLRYEELPSILWAVVGYRIEDIDRFISFGKLRNSIIHFAIPEIEIDKITLRFAFEVLEPIIFDFWQESILKYVYEYEDSNTMFVEERLKQLDINYLNF